MAASASGIRHGINENNGVAKWRQRHQRINGSISGGNKASGILWHGGNGESMA